MDLFDIVTARKLSGGGGGGGTTVEALSVTQNGTYTAPLGTAYSPVTVNVSGGSSDFSTATVTVVTNESFLLNNSIIVDDEFGELITNEAFESYDYPLLLYKGEFGANITAPEGMQVANAIGSGGVSVSPSLGGAYAVTITGDGTLNVTVE